jgi:anti-sigma factor RsiW
MLKRQRAPLPEGCLSDLTFHTLEAGELTLDADQAAHLATCPRCSARKAELTRIHGTLSAGLPELAPWSLPSAAPKQSARSLRYAPALALAAAALLALWTGREGPATDTRSKGGVALDWYVRRGTQVLPSEAVTAARSGDVLRFVVSSSERPFVAVYAATAEGLSVYYPPSAEAARLPNGAREVPLDGAVELDDSALDEQLIAVFCADSFLVHALMDAVSAGAPLPGGCVRAERELRKGRAP